MCDNKSSGEGPHDQLKAINDLCEEVNVGLANQLSDGTVNELRRWARLSPRKTDECLLAVHERNGLPDFCIAWLSTNGYKVVSIRTREIRGRDALMLWRSKLRTLSASPGDLCLFLRGLNFLTVAEQQALWASLVEALPPACKVRFAYSFVPLTEEFDSVRRNDVWMKLADRTSVWIEHA